MGFAEKASITDETNIGPTRFGVTYVYWDAGRDGKKAKKLHRQIEDGGDKTHGRVYCQTHEGIKKSVVVTPVQVKEDAEKVMEMKENEDPNLTNKNGIGDLTPPFVVDLLTQEDGVERSRSSHQGRVARLPILEDGKRVDGRAHPRAGYASFKLVQRKVEQIFLLTGMRWERLPCLCLEN